ncbi:oligopeptide transport ATP-binding protein OppF [bacterium BMS3Abin07]|nr:oligopeptide transport ATP-binding protein OppF [bacterium BMS3Abin07]GBE32780.1 oligopeptide transport ATP-binding protein OppF [bacterium BMS3Bbin05]HDO21567.1 ATP-binding cassette domain-containing protein [Nitrospirota bacterium]HDZ87239.1 ATP-binding cassette domain-containing protein [Nitrospirota bacterium]
MAFIDVKNIKKHFQLKKGVRGKGKVLKAVDDVSFKVEKDSVFAIVGESGCGKSTLARILVRLIEPTSGTVSFNGEDLFNLKRTALKKFRRSVQIIFQDPYASLNPRMRVYSTISEPMKIHRIVPSGDLKERVAELLTSVGLTPDMMDKYPHEFSGGQRQRICIARALSLSPEMIVADEPLSSLDVSIQAQIINLLQDLKQKHHLSFIFISHDLNVVHYFSDMVAVMYLGRIMELADTDELFERPLHPYTELLLKSAPKIGVKNRSKHVSNRMNATEIPSPVDIPDGCLFYTRCPKRFDACNRIIPQLKKFEGHSVRCLLYS